ncbi:MAG: hypothetical protein LBS31_04060 [Candidatus Adiutrix sp.]|jgi:phosphoribosylglycinamide formyltransferase-1|nr:hypothetical protein [Candidatus Adiutrix sp.]
MGANIGVLCSDDGEKLSLLIEAVQKKIMAAEIKIVVAGRAGAEALTLARQAGFYAVFVPRAAYHANRDGYERRLGAVLREAGAEAVVLAGYEWTVGEVLREAFPGRLANLNEAGSPEEMAALAASVGASPASLAGQAHGS